MLLLLIPVTIASLAGLLFFTEALERRSSDVLLRLAIRSARSSPEATETLVAAELARRLDAAGLGQRPVHEVAASAHVSPAVVERVLAAAEDTGQIPISELPAPAH